MRSESSTSGDLQLPTLMTIARHLQTTTHHFQPPASRSPLATRYSLPAAHCLLLCFPRPLPLTTHYLPLTTYCASLFCSAQVAEQLDPKRRMGPKALENDSLYSPVVLGHEKIIKDLFEKLDVGKDGELDITELQDIVAFYEDSPFDEQEFFGYWDVKADDGGGRANGAIDLEEFGWYMADMSGRDSAYMPHTIRQFGEAMDYVNATKAKLSVQQYVDTVKGHESAIKALFERIDASGEGELDASELSELVSTYSGEPFDEVTFIRAWNTDGDGIIDLGEFGMYVAGCAGGDTEKMLEAITKLHTAMDHVEAKRWALDA